MAGPSQPVMTSSSSAVHWVKFRLSWAWSITVVSWSIHTMTLCRALIMLLRGSLPLHPCLSFHPSRCLFNRLCAEFTPARWLSVALYIAVCCCVIRATPTSMPQYIVAGAAIAVGVGPQTGTTSKYPCDIIVKNFGFEPPDAHLAGIVGQQTIRPPIWLTPRILLFKAEHNMTVRLQLTRQTQSGLLVGCTR